MNVTRQLHHIGVTFNQDALKTSLEQMAPSKMAAIESSGVRYAEPLHGPGQIGSPGLKQEMVVVGHEHESIYFNTKAIACLSQSFQKHFPIHIVTEDIPSCVSS